jgi:hypothetical protein
MTTLTAPPVLQIRPTQGFWLIAIELGDIIVMASCGGTQDDARREARRQLQTALIEEAA